MRTQMKKFQMAILAAIVNLAMGVLACGQTYTDLYDFDGVHGASPIWPEIIAQGEDGRLYSTTYEGGLSNSGVIFKISPAGDLSVLYTFKGRRRRSSKWFDVVSKRELLRHGFFWGR